MAEQLLEDEGAFVAEIRAFVAKNLPESVREKVAGEEHLSREEHTAWQSQLYRHGWAAPGWPKEHGGTGWTIARQYVFKREMGLSLAPDPSPFGLQMVGPVIYTFGSDEQKRRHLPGILAGTTHWCQGFSEPGAGSDLAALRTRAEDRGDHFLVNGQKIWTSAAHMADWIFCLARTSQGQKRQQGISFLLFDMKTPGITVRPIVSLDGRHHLNEVFFEDVRVPRDGLVGEDGQGWTYAKFLLGHERFGISNVPRLRRRVERLRQLAREGADRAAGFSGRLAEIEVDLVTVEQMELSALRRAMAGGKGGVDASILKLASSELLQRADALLWDGAGACRLLAPGPRCGDERSAPAALITRAMFHGRAATVYGGTSEVQRNIVAQLTLGEIPDVWLPEEVPADQRAIADGVDRFVRERCGLERQKAWREARGEDGALWEELGALGWLAAPLPEAAGGMALSATEIAVIMRGFGRGLVTAPYVPAILCAARILAEDPGRAGLLAGIVEGKRRATYAGEEPAGLPNDPPANVVAERADGGWILRGSKRLVPGVEGAEVVVVAARDQGGELHLFAIPAGTSGMRRVDRRAIDGRLLSDLVLEEVKLPDDALVLYGATAEAAAEAAAARASVAACAETVGAMEAAVRLTHEYLLTRKQFGTLLGDFQVLRHRFADMVGALRAARDMAAAAAAALDRAGDPAERARTISAACVQTMTAGRALGEAAVQLHGGIGIADEHAIGHFYKRLLVCGSLFGDRSHHLAAFARASSTSRGP